jgi:hypothetical protein
MREAEPPPRVFMMFLFINNMGHFSFTYFADFTDFLLILRLNPLILLTKFK